MIKRLVLFGILLCYISTSLADSSWTVNTVHPLSLDYVAKNDNTYKIVKDKTGFLWLATDAGLKRYDGYKTKDFVYDDTDITSIGSNSINSLLIDQEQILWAGGENLNRYYPETQTFKRYDVTGGSAIWALHKTTSNLIWVGGEGFGLRGYDLDKEKTLFQLFEQGPSRFVNGIIPALDSNEMWVGTNGGLYLFDPNTATYEVYFTPESLYIDNFLMRDMAMDDDGRLWMVSEEGLVVVDPKSRKVRHYIHNSDDPSSLKTSTLWSVFKDSEGRMWIGTDKQGVHIYNAELDNFDHIPASPNESDTLAFPPTSINDIYQDVNGSMWFASPFYGVRRISSQLEKFITLNEISGVTNSLGFNNILDLHQAKNGLIWIATDGGGLDSFDAKTGIFTNYKHDRDNPDSLSSNSVIAIDEDDAGRLWLGTYNGGVNIFDPASDKFERLMHDKKRTENQTIGNNNVFDIHFVSSSQIFISVWRKGLQIYNSETKEFESYFAGIEGGKNGISNYSINHIVPDGKGKYWIAGHAGLEVFDPKTKHFTKIELPAIDDIFEILPDADSSIWLATPNGLVKYNSESGETISYSKADGLSDNFIVSLDRDSVGNIWIGTRFGLNRFNPNDNVFTVFTQAEGLSSNQFNRLSHLYSRDGNMYFGGPAGINIFNPEDMPRNEHLPKVVITEFEVNQRPVKIGPSQVLTKHISLTSELQLEYWQNNMSFEFTALNFVSPSQNRFRYRLIGFENNWAEVDAHERRVRYTNLDPGEYHFEVMGSNNEGLWNSEPATISINISLPWWDTWWAKVGLVLFVLYAIRIVIVVQNKKNIDRANDLELKVAQRTEELNHSNQELENAIENLKDAQDKLVESKKMAALGVMVSGVAHEVNTPLGVCVTAITHVQSIAHSLFNKFDSKLLKNSDLSKFRSDFNTGTDLISSNLTRAAELVKSFKKVAIEQTLEKPTKFLFDDFMQDVLTATAPKFKNREVEIHVKCENNLELTSFPGVISQVIISFIMNSLRHGFDQNDSGNIYLDIQRKGNDDVCIQYSDDGKGINPDFISQIFEPFFTTSRHQGNAGLGLNIVYNLVTQKLKGEIIVNTPERGVEFVVTFKRHTT